MRSNALNKNFFLLPNDLFGYELKPKEFIVYCYLIRCGDAKMQSFPSRKDIAKKCRMSVPTVDNSLKALEDKGLISITHRNDINNGNHLSHLYTIQKTW